jgi:hypothetical protein
MFKWERLRRSKLSSLAAQNIRDSRARRSLVNGPKRRHSRRPVASKTPSLRPLAPSSCTAVDSTDFTSSPCCCVCCHDCWPYIVSRRSRGRCGVGFATEHYCCLLFLSHADLIAVSPASLWTCSFLSRPPACACHLSHHATPVEP